MNNEHEIKKKEHTALIYDGGNENVGERKTPLYIGLRTSKLRASNCKLLLDTGSNTVFYCKVGCIACDGSGKDATMSIVAMIWIKMKISTRYKLNENTYIQQEL